jgi:hypothetical protein
MKDETLRMGVVVLIVAATFPAAAVAGGQSTPDASQNAHELNRIRASEAAVDARGEAPGGESGLDRALGPLPLTGWDLITIVTVGLAVAGAGLAMGRSLAHHRGAKPQAEAETIPGTGSRAHRQSAAGRTNGVGAGDQPQYGLEAGAADRVSSRAGG